MIAIYHSNMIEIYFHQCRPKCSRKGKRHRMLTCVWSVSNKPAQANCNSKPKPVLWKRCKPKKCKKGNRVFRNIHINSGIDVNRRSARKVTLLFRNLNINLENV